MVSLRLNVLSVNSMRKPVFIPVVSNDYLYHGLIKQRSDKFVHVYSKEWSGEELGDNCYSNMFVWTDGLEYPEIGKYKWMTYDEIVGHGVKAYYPIFREIVNNS